MCGYSSTPIKSPCLGGCSLKADSSWCQVFLCPRKKENRVITSLVFVPIRQDSRTAKERRVTDIGIDPATPATLVRQWIGIAKKRTGRAGESRDSVSAVDGLFSVKWFQVARCRRGPLICTLYAMVQGDQKVIERRRRNANKKKEATHSAKVAGEATFLSLREISYSPNACLELCGAHVKWQSPADCGDNEFGDLGEAMAKNRP